MRRASQESDDSPRRAPLPPSRPQLPADFEEPRAAAGQRVQNLELSRTGPVEATRGACSGPSRATSQGLRGLRIGG
eukprot:13959035-Alexandrium_andersonii.AAC.1